MKVLPLLASVVLISSCATGEQGKIYGPPPKPVLSYDIDTVYRTYATDLTDKIKGASDLHVLDTSLTIIVNYCGPGELAILDHQSDVFRKVLTFPGDCRDIFTKYTPEFTYILNRDGYLLQFSRDSRQGKILANFKNDSSLVRLGLDVEQHKSGSQLMVNVPDNVFYFRVMQNLDTEKGKYGYQRMKSGYPIVCKYDLAAKTLQFFGSQPEFAATGAYGLYSNINSMYKGDSIILTDAVSGRITVIDTRTNLTSAKETRSRYDSIPTPLFKMPRKFSSRKTAKIDHWTYSASYDAIYYNPSTHCYYRVFHPALPREKGNGLLNTAYDKQSILMVLDEHFDLIDEKPLPVARQNIYSILPVENGIEIYFPELFDFTKTYSTYAYLRITHSPVT